MKALYYPAIITIEQDGITVDVIGLDGCITCGNTIDEAYKNAIDAIGLYLTNEKTNEINIIPPTSEYGVKLNKNERIMYVRFDPEEYLEKYSKKAINKTVSLPYWLNAQAARANAPFSHILQEGLKEYLHLK